MRTVDERVVHSPLSRIFDLAVQVERWPEHLTHYRYVRFRERGMDEGGLVEMSANRPFGPINWPTWWLSRMAVVRQRKVDGEPTETGPLIRFRHVGGITAGMDVEWSFAPEPGADATRVRIVHIWDGPPWPLLGGLAAVGVIGPVFVHGIASRTLAGLAVVAERGARREARLA